LATIDFSLGRAACCKSLYPVNPVEEVSGLVVSFSPARITVAEGTKITFANGGKAPQNATSSRGGG
jgi:plastocyanin